MYFREIQLSHKAIDFVEEPLLASLDRGGTGTDFDEKFSSKLTT